MNVYLLYLLFTFLQTTIIMPRPKQDCRRGARPSLKTLAAAAAQKKKKEEEEKEKKKKKKGEGKTKNEKDKRKRRKRKRSGRRL